MGAPSEKQDLALSVIQSHGDPVRAVRQAYEQGISEVLRGLSLSFWEKCPTGRARAEFVFTNIRLEGFCGPNTPEACLAKGETYGKLMVADICITICMESDGPASSGTGESKEYKLQSMHICPFPLMVAGEQCGDAGGYFVTRASHRSTPKAMVTRQMKASNVVSLAVMDGKRQVAVRSTSPPFWSPVRLMEAREKKKNQPRVVLVTDTIADDPERGGGVESEGGAPLHIPIGLLLRKLADEEEVEGMCAMYDPLVLARAMEEMAKADDVDSATRTFLAEHRGVTDAAFEAFVKDRLLCHEPGKHAKARFLCHMLDVFVTGEVAQYNRFDLNFCRFKHIGTDIADCIRSTCKRYVKDVAKPPLWKDLGQTWAANRGPGDGLHNKIRNILTSAIDSRHKGEARNKHLFSRGRGRSRGRAWDSAADPLQIIELFSRAKTVAQVLKVNKEMGGLDHAIAPRQLHPSTWGLLCCADTPENEEVGIQQSLALLATFSHAPAQETRAGLEDRIRMLIDPPGGDAPTSKHVFFDGKIVGSLPQSRVASFVDEASRMFREHAGYKYGTASEFLGHVYVWCDGGRLMRPVLLKRFFDEARIVPVDRVSPGGLGVHQRLGMRDARLSKLFEFRVGDTPLTSEDAFRDAGYLTYVDSYTQGSRQIFVRPEDASSPEDLVEVHPSIIFGVAANSIPFAEYNATVRNLFQCSMSKQNLAPFTREVPRCFPAPHRSVVPFALQFPLVANRTASALGMNELPGGQNVMVAIYAAGDNQEDSLVFNEQFVQNGAFDLLKIRQERVTLNSNERFDPTVCLKPGQLVRPNDKLIGKTREIAGVRKDTSTFCKEKARVLSVHESSDSMVVVLATRRTPKVGDKFATRCGQKGTIGCIKKRQDLPRNADGIVPSIIINSHAFNKRMTMAQLTEMLVGKAHLATGVRTYGDAFAGTDHIKVAQALLGDAGLDRFGEETFYDAFTGEPLRETVFFGPVNYQRLNHLVTEKMYACPYDCVSLDPVTRQPKQGRANDGGMRLGRMEGDALVAHGVAASHYDRIITSSDAYRTVLCQKCGTIAHYAEQTGRYRCDSEFCAPSALAPVTIPYGLILFNDKMAATNTRVRLVTEPTSKLTRLGAVEDGEAPTPKRRAAM